MEQRFKPRNSEDFTQMQLNNRVNTFGKNTPNSKFNCNLNLRKMSNDNYTSSASKSISPTKHSKKYNSNYVLRMEPTMEEEEDGVPDIKKNSYWSKVNKKEELSGISNKPCHYYSSPSAQSFKEYAYQEYKNLEYREAMEDCAKIFDHFSNDPYKSFFSLYDGHGGVEVAKYVSERLPQLFQTRLGSHKNNIEKALSMAFNLVDEELKQMKNTNNIGATGTICFINRETDAKLGTKKVLYCANVGDSSCVWFSKSGCKKLSYDHKCTDKNEILRIKKLKGTIWNDRLGGKLAISRAFGDFTMKSKGWTCEPSINKTELTDSDKFIIICTDGIWDVLDEEDLFYLTLNCEETDQISDDIIKLAKENDSKDNMSCIVIKL